MKTETLEHESNVFLSSEKIGSINRHGAGKMKGKIQLLNFQLQKDLVYAPGCFFWAVI